MSIVGYPLWCRVVCSSLRQALLRFLSVISVYIRRMFSSLFFFYGIFFHKYQFMYFFIHKLDHLLFFYSARVEGRV